MLMTLYSSTSILLKQSKKFCGLMEDYLSHQSISKEKMEIDNLKLYGYGIKGYISMIEAAMRISNNTL
jgi:putative hydrolase of the HAD superfamily